jgi:hypothetical protein
MFNISSELTAEITNNQINLFLSVTNPSKPSADYMYHLVSHPVTPYFAHRVYSWILYGSQTEQ